MKNFVRILLFFVVLSLAILAVVIALRPQPVKVETARAGFGPLQMTIDAEGKTRAHHRFIIASPVTGKLARITLDRGDWVESGAIIARIEPPPLMPLDPRQHAEADARVAAAQSIRSETEVQVERVRADCDQLRRERVRAETLVENGDIARQEFERARNAETSCARQLEAAQYKARAASAEVEVAKAALIAIEQAGQPSTTATVIVRSPVRGRVLKLIEESERVVSAGAPLLELSGPSGLEIVIDLLSTDAVKVRPGAQVLIENWGGTGNLRARVRMIEPAAFTKISALGVEEQRVNIIADFIDRALALGDGYRVEAKVVLWEAERVMCAPSSAIYPKEAGWYVFVIENGRARERRIEISHRTAYKVEILRGLEEGEEVILYPNNQITDGLLVTSR